MATKRRLLTIDDLVKFCSEQNFTKFSSKETGYKLSVQVPATFEIDENVDSDHRGMMKLKFRIFHTGLNRNGSFVSEDAAKKAMPTIKNRPIMAYIHQLDNGDWDFEAHNMRIITNEDGEEEVVYDESQVGSFSEGEPFFEYDEELDKTYVCAYGYIPEEYTKCADIIRAKNGTKNSCELSIEELSYNAKEHYLDLQEFYLMGSTLLGSRKDGTPIGEGMLGSRADIADFSEQNNSMFSYENSKLIETLERLNDTLSNFNINNQSKEGGTEPVNKLEELLSKYNKTVEDITFEYENLSDEELEAKFAEVFEDNSTDGEGNDPEPTSDGDNGDATEVDNSTPEDTTAVNSEDDDNSDNNEGSSEDGNPSGDDDSSNNEGTQFAEKLVRTYEISHEDIRYALYGLLASYEESDNEWYFINAVYDTYFTYENWYGDKIFGQAYVKDGDNVSFDGERYNLHKEFLTDSEYAELQSMRANYSSIVEQLATYQKAEVDSQKAEIIADEAYAEFADTDEFKEITANIDNYSIDELKTACDLAFAKCVKKNGNFSLKTKEEKPEKKVNKIGVNANFEKTDDNEPYGDYFKSLQSY